jgi:hypothetical protein
VLSPHDPDLDATRVTPVQQTGLPPGTVARLSRAGIETLEEVANLREWELFRRGLWLGDVRKIVAALSRHGLSLRDGTLGGPARGTAGLAAPAAPTPLRREERQAHGEAGLLRRERDALIVAARARGDTLQEAGAPFGLSRERVRQILARAGAGDLESAKSARARRQRAAAEMRRKEVLTAWRTGSALREISTSLGLSRASVTALIASYATDSDRGARRRALFTAARCARPLGYSDEDLVRAVRHVTETTGRVPSSKQYSRIAKAEGLPSLSTIENRFGGWNDAVRAAGHTPMPANQRKYERRWTEEQCLDALHALVAELGQIPSQEVYRRLSPERPDLPSASTVRIRVGPWSAVALRLERGEGAHGATTTPARSEVTRGRAAAEVSGGWTGSSCSAERGS